MRQIKSCLILIFTFILLFSTGTYAAFYMSISGRVVRKDNGMPVKDVTVKAFSYDNENSIGKMIDEKAQTNSNGEYIINYLPPGKYSLRAKLPQNFPDERRYTCDPETSPDKAFIDVQIEPGRNVVNLNWQVRKSVSIMKGKVYKSDGVTPLEEGDVIFANESKSATSYPIRANGEFKIENRFLTKGEFIINCPSDYTYAFNLLYRTNQHIDIGDFADTSGIVLIYNEPGKINLSGTVKDTTGIGMNVTVSLTNKTGLHISVLACSDSTGYFYFKGLPSGKYSIELGNSYPEKVRGGLQRAKDLTITPDIIVNSDTTLKIDLIWDENKAIDRRLPVLDILPCNPIDSNQREILKEHKKFYECAKNDFVDAAKKSCQEFYFERDSICLLLAGWSYMADTDWDFDKHEPYTKWINLSAIPTECIKTCMEKHENVHKRQL
ncbi:MAG: carboxypeptidase regulatory-like domain-containing protein, partial [Candidatus Firestonebacteria bacterium]|nr:carboxypeptidase regulatory-like domain-containing protein [Candidatus Firestonebacteria bacterium]